MSLEHPANDQTDQTGDWLPPQVERLAPREREVALAVYNLGAATAKDVEARLSDEITNAAVRSMLMRLVQKGILERKGGSRGGGLAAVYLPKLTLDHSRKFALMRASEIYFGGSMFRLAAAAIEMLDMNGEGKAARDYVRLKAHDIKNFTNPAA